LSDIKEKVYELHWSVLVEPSSVILLTKGMMTPRGVVLDLVASWPGELQNTAVRDKLLGTPSFNRMTT